MPLCLLAVACGKKPDASGAAASDTAHQAPPTSTPAALEKAPEKAPTALAGPRVYVSNEDSDDISVIDVATDKEVGRIAVGKRPRGLRVSPDQTRLYVAVSGSPKAKPGVDEKTLPPADHGADGILVIDVRTGAVLRRLDAGSDPEMFDLSSDGALLYASNEDSGKVSIIDIAAGKLLGSVPVGDEPEGVTTRPDGSVFYVTSEEDHRIDVVDPVSRKVVASVKSGIRPRAIVFTPDGASAIVSNELSGSIGIIDARTHKPKSELKLGLAESRPMGLALSHDAKRVFVTTGRGRSVAEVDLAEGRVTRVIADVGARPWGIAITADGKKLYTANGPSNDVAVIDVESGKVRAHIAAGSSPWGVAYADPSAAAK